MQRKPCDKVKKREAIGRLDGITHDFNNNLRSIAGSGELARRRVGEGRIADTQRFLDITRTAVDRAGALTHRLLAFARRQRLDPRPVDPDGLVAGMTEMIRRTMGPGSPVELDIRDGALGVLCDPNEALLILCINARDALPEGGKLVIGTADAHLKAERYQRGGSQAGALRGDLVPDTGEGMPPAVMARVFGPFYTDQASRPGNRSRIEPSVSICPPVTWRRPYRERSGLRDYGSPFPASLRLSTGGTGVAADPQQAQVGQTLLLVDDEEAVRRARIGASARVWISGAGS